MWGFERTNTIQIYWTMSSNSINHSTLHSEHDWEELCVQLRNPETGTSYNRNWNQGRIDFQSDVFCWCVIVDLLIKQNIRLVYGMGRSWRTWKPNRITRTCTLSMLCSPSWAWWMSPWTRRHLKRSKLVIKKFKLNLVFPPTLFGRGENLQLCVLKFWSPWSSHNILKLILP